MIRCQFLISSLLVLSISSAQAITIDNLALDKTKPVGQQTNLPSDRQVVTSSGPVNTSSSTVISGQQILGGTRFVQVQVLGGFNVTNAIDGGFLSHSQDAATKGTSFVVWDGNSALGIQPAGLGGLDLTQDGATGMKIVIEAYDFATSQPIKVIFTIYDASDPTGTKKVSVGTLVLNAAVSSTEIRIIPFSSFVKLDTAQAPANLATVGAISMTIDGSQSVSHDLVLSFIGTDGRCDHIPSNRLVLDQCGVCNGNNLSCADCDGTPNGSKVAGVGCSTGNFGVCGEGSLTGKYPSCSCSQTKTPSTEICDGVDNDCDGSIDNGSPKTGPLVDTCGVCGGNGSTCALSCKSLSIDDVRASLDGGAKDLEAVVIRAASLLRSIPQGKNDAKLVSQTLQTAHKLQIRNWVLAYSLPAVSVTCTNAASICTTSSNLTILDEYRLHNEELKQLAITLLDKAKRYRRGKLTSREQRLYTAAENQFQKNLALSRTVPETQFACSKK